MPPDDPDSLVALLPQGVAAVIGAQQELDVPASDDERRSGTRFWLTSIPSAEIRLEFGLSLTEKRGVLVPRRTTSSLRHLVSLSVQAVPEPIDPPPGTWDKSPFTLFEPAFMVDPEREIDLGLRVCDALRDNACTLRVPDPDSLKEKTIRKAGDKLREQLVLPDHPELGVLAFRVSQSPPVDLVVIVTDEARKDGVFLVEANQPPALYSIPDDKNEAMFYEPLHRLTMALGEWLSGAAARRRSAVQRLPEEWGFTTLEVFADNLIAGYQQCIGLLSEPRSVGSLTQQFDVNRVTAEVAFGVRQLGAPSITIVQDPGSGRDLIHGQVLIELERNRNAIAATLTLVAPGFVLATGEREAFIASAQEEAETIAKAFRDDRSVDYLAAIKQPSNAAGIVVLLSVKKPGDPFKYLVTWPARTGGGERHFVFRCRQNNGSLDDVEAVMRASDSLDALAVVNAADSLQVDDDVYDEYNRFFRAARVWRSGVSLGVQRALLDND